MDRLVALLIGLVLVAMFCRLLIWDAGRIMRRDTCNGLLKTRRQVRWRDLWYWR